MLALGWTGGGLSFLNGTKEGRGGHGEGPQGKARLPSSGQWPSRGLVVGSSWAPGCRSPRTRGCQVRCAKVSRVCSLGLLIGRSPPPRRGRRLFSFVFFFFADFRMYANRQGSAEVCIEGRVVVVKDLACPYDVLKVLGLCDEGVQVQRWTESGNCRTCTTWCV